MGRDELSDSESSMSRRWRWERALWHDKVDANTARRLVKMFFGLDHDTDVTWTLGQLNADGEIDKTVDGSTRTLLQGNGYTRFTCQFEADSLAKAEGYVHALTLALINTKDLTGLREDDPEPVSDPMLCISFAYTLDGVLRVESITEYANVDWSPDGPFLDQESVTTAFRQAQQHLEHTYGPRRAEYLTILGIIPVYQPERESN